MKRKLQCSLVSIFLMSIMTVPGFAQAEHGQHGPVAMDHSKSGMMSMKMGEQRGMSCMSKPSSLAGQLDKMTCMMTGKMHMKSGKMHSMMKRGFFLDRIQDLGLQAEQVAHLKTLYADCRRDNLRTATEAKIARFELDDLLESDWSLEVAEELIRKIAQLEGDMKIRHLSAIKDAFSVLTDEQVAQLHAANSPESLFDE